MRSTSSTDTASEELTVLCEDRDVGGILPEQATAVAHRGADARLLAGPGTGKTWTLVDHVVGLINDGCPASEILCLTFTRAAAAGFRKKITNALPAGADLPEVYTLHAFALRQLMKLRANIGSGAGRARVADDWEERFVVVEDLARILGTNVTDVKKRLAALAAEWETAPGITPTVDPPVLGALQEDKGRYRYVLRSELVFDLHREMDSDPALLAGEYRHVVVDEYQDLNKCDVAVIDELGRRGSQLYVAGDDDQSIYEQLRHAHPQAIRDFVGNHAGAGDLKLQTCIRCDGKIIELAKEVIAGEPGRVAKALDPHPTAGPGIVEIMTFPGQSSEARAIAVLAKKFIDAGVAEDQIMVLLRSDHQGAMSEPIYNAFQAARVLSIIRTADETALGTKQGRTLLAHLRLSLDAGDDLAWRTILDSSNNGIGMKTIAAIEAVSDTDHVSFGGGVAAVASLPARISRGAVVKGEFDAVNVRLTAVAALSPLDVADKIEAFHARLPPSPELDAARDELVGLARSYATLTDLAEYLVAIALKKEEEQSVVPGVVNIMTMHKAKGLDACVVFVPAAEEEMYVRDPAGRNEARRLFYVSITRAMHALFISHALTRTGRQSRLGTNVTGRRRRTTFLDTRGTSTPGAAFARDYVVNAALLQTIAP
jgi:DNA helicase-2/ATP-dependent DNA helicase PcrA